MSVISQWVLCLLLAGDWGWYMLLAREVGCLTVCY